MKRERRTRKRKLRRTSKEDVIKQLTDEKVKHTQTKKCSKFNRKLAELYWDRWRHEVEERKYRKQLLPLKHTKVKTATLSQIPRSLLIEFNELSSTSSANEQILGRGSFGIVKHFLYRGIHVAVKEFYAQVSIETVGYEARFLSKLCHPYLPLFFGLNTSVKPYYIVTQYYGIDGQSVTIHKELLLHTYVCIPQEWLTLCGQLVEALRYLHEDAKCIHNDIKTDNILLTNTNRCSSVTPELLCDHQVVLIDFNKATESNKGRLYTLSNNEKTLHYAHHPHIAPEVIEGTSKQNSTSDIFSLGKTFKQICSKAVCKAEMHKSHFKKLELFAMQCMSMEPNSRPKACSLANKFKQVLKGISLK